MIDCAPCEPPNTSSTCASSANPKCARASARSAIRSSDVIAARTGTPTTSACRSPGSGTAESTRRADRAPTRLAQPALALASWMTTGTGDAAAPAARGQVGGQRDVAAEADHDVGVDVVEHRAGLPDGAAHPQRQPHQVAGRLAGQRHRRDELEVVTAFGHQPGLQAALGAQRGDPHLGVQRAQRIGDRHGGFDVACRPPPARTTDIGPFTRDVDLQMCEPVRDLPVCELVRPALTGSALTASMMP